MKKLKYSLVVTNTLTNEVEEVARFKCFGDLANCLTQFRDNLKPPQNIVYSYIKL